MGLVGDMSSRQFDDLDYIIRVPQVHPAVSALAGLVAAVVVILTGVTLWEARRQNRVSRGCLTTPVLLCAAGALLALGWRMVTAGVIGANIGGTGFLILGLPIAVALLIAAGVNAWKEPWR